MFVGPKKGRLFERFSRNPLTTKAVQCATLSFQCVHDVHSRNGFAFRMLGVGDGVSNNIFEKDFEYTSGFFVDETRNSLDTTTSCQTTDGRFGDTLDVITENFSVTLCAALSKPLASFTSTGHDVRSLQNRTITAHD